MAHKLRVVINGGFADLVLLGGFGHTGVIRFSKNRDHLLVGDSALSSYGSTRVESHPLGKHWFEEAGQVWLAALLRMASVTLVVGVDVERL